MTKRAGMRAVHPGEVLQDTVLRPDVGLSVTEFARRLVTKAERERTQTAFGSFEVAPNMGMP